MTVDDEMSGRLVLPELQPVVSLPPRDAEWQQIISAAASRHRQRVMRRVIAVGSTVVVCLAVVAVATVGWRHSAASSRTPTLVATPGPSPSASPLPIGLPTDALPFPPATSFAHTRVAIVPVPDSTAARISRDRAVQIFHDELHNYTLPAGPIKAQLVEIYSQGPWIGERVTTQPSDTFHDAGLYWLVSVPTPVGDIAFIGAGPAPGPTPNGTTPRPAGSDDCVTQIPINAINGKPAEIMQDCDRTASLPSGP